MFDGMDFSKMGSMLEDMKKKAMEIQEKAQSQEYEVKSGGGMIKVKINGKSEILDIEIDDSLLGDKESLQILLISAINEAIKLTESEKQKLAVNALGLGGL